MEGRRKALPLEDGISGQNNVVFFQFIDVGDSGCSMPYKDLHSIGVRDNFVLPLHDSDSGAVKGLAPRIF